MGSHSVICYPTQVKALTPARKLVLDLPTPAGWKAELIYRLPGNAPAGIRTRDLSITSPTPYHYSSLSIIVSSLRIVQKQLGGRAPYRGSNQGTSGVSGGDPPRSHCGRVQCPSTKFLDF